MPKLVFFIRGGSIACLHDDDAVDFIGKMGVGVPTTKRASHVEPAAAGGWEADLAPCDGPILGPFPTRRAALEAEAEWIRLHVLGRPLDAPKGEVS